ncbi:MAG: hypothetical protein CMM07_05450 [Rhodopirellula sp.]|nr:hypothetical protein [Rhodopirellula sp.]
MEKSIHCDEVCQIKIERFKKCTRHGSKISLARNISTNDKPVRSIFTHSITGLTKRSRECNVILHFSSSSPTQGNDEWRRTSARHRIVKNRGSLSVFTFGKMFLAAPDSPFGRVIDFAPHSLCRFTQYCITMHNQ